MINSHSLTLPIKAQEEMAWQIAKMIVNDVVHQSNHNSPVKSTKVRQRPAATVHTHTHTLVCVKGLEMKGASSVLSSQL